MARVELPPSKLKMRKRRRRLRLLLLAGSLLAVVVLIAAWLTHIPFIHIRTIEVVGAETISSSSVQALIKKELEGSYYLFFPKRNIFLYPKQEITELLRARYPVLSSAQVHANDFQTLGVVLVERTARALWCQDERCYFMDENGVLYGDAPQFSAPVYTRYRGALSKVSLPQQFLTPTDFQALTALVDAIVRKLPEEELSSVVVDKHRDVDMYFMSGFILRFALNEEGGDVYERFVLALGANHLDCSNMYKRDMR